MGDHAHAFHLVEVFLDLQMSGNGAFHGGMYHRMCIVMESDLVFARESANAHDLIWELPDQVISGPDGLGCFRGCSRLGCSHCCGNGCRAWGFVPGCVVVMAQFIFTTASFLFEGRPRMVGQGCLQHTNMNLPCGVEHQGGLAAM